MEEIQELLGREETERAQAEVEKDERDDTLLYEEAEDAIIDALILENGEREDRERPMASGASS